MGNKTIGDRIKRLREERGLTQKQLCAEVPDLELNINTLASYERNNREPKIETIVKLARFFGVTTDYLLGLSNFNDLEEFRALLSGLDDTGDVSEFSIKTYRKMKSCMEKAGYFYREKMRQYDGGGSGELFFCLFEKVGKDIEAFDNVLSILLNYRDFSDRDAAVRAFVLNSDSSKLTARVIEEILRIDREI